MKTAIYAGSFDIFTNGHLSIVMSALKICDRLLVVVAKNESKKNLFCVDERVSLIKKVLKNKKQVDVIATDGLVTDLAKKYKASFFIRGLRDVDDFLYESKMARMNEKLNDSFPTVFLLADSDNALVSSSLIKEIARHNGAIEHFVPLVIAKEILKKMEHKL